MNAKKVNQILGGLVVVLCLALIIGAKSITSVLSGNSDNLVNLQIKQNSLESEQEQLKNAKKEIARYQPLAAITKTIVPQDKDQAEAVREIVNIAESSGISLSGISYPKSDLGSAGSSNSKINLSQLTRVPDIPGVYDLPISIASDQKVSFGQFISFLSKLENNRRTAQVTNVTLNPDQKDPSQLSFSLSINEYIKP